MSKKLKDSIEQLMKTINSKAFLWRLLFVIFLALSLSVMVTTFSAKYLPDGTSEDKEIKTTDIFDIIYDDRKGWEYCDTMADLTIIWVIFVLYFILAWALVFASRRIFQEKKKEPERIILDVEKKSIVEWINMKKRLPSFVSIEDSSTDPIKISIPQDEFDSWVRQYIKEHFEKEN